MTCGISGISRVFGLGRGKDAFSKIRFFPKAKCFYKKMNVYSFSRKNNGWGYGNETVV